MSGRTIRNFQLVEQIGSGGMGIIWRAVQTSLDRQVALKELHPHIARDKEFITRFEREAKSAAALEHENIVGVIDFGQEGDAWFIAMELIDGPDLRSLLDKEPRVPAPVAVSITLDVLRGLHAAHGRGIVHRDMKPANVLLTKDGTAKVADFSVAQSSTTPSVTTTGAMLGTPAYMSPEQAMGNMTLDARSDVFAVGTLLYEMLSGKRAFDGPTYPAMLNAVLHAEPQRLEALDAGVPASIASVVRRAMEKILTHRYASAEEFARDLEQAAADESVPHSRRIVADWIRDPKGLGDSIRRKQAQERLERAQWLSSKANAQLEESLAALAAAVALDPSNEDARREYDLARSRMAKPGSGTVRLPDPHIAPTGESAVAPRTPTPARPPTVTSFGMQPASLRFLVVGGWALAAVAIVGLFLAGARRTGAEAIRKRALAIRQDEGPQNALEWLEKKIDARPELEPKLRPTRAVLETEKELRDDRSWSRKGEIAWNLTHKYKYAEVPFVAANVIAETNIRATVLPLYTEALERDPSLRADPRIADAALQTLNEYPPTSGYYEYAEKLLLKHYPKEWRQFAEANIDGRGAALLNAVEILSVEGDPRATVQWLQSLSAYTHEQNMDANEAILLEVKGRDAQILSALRSAIDDGNASQKNKPRMIELAKKYDDRVAPVAGPSARISVSGWPPLRVHLDGTEIAPTTPLIDWRVAPGRHTLRVIDAKNGNDLVCDVTLKENADVHAYYDADHKSLNCR